MKKIKIFDKKNLPEKQEEGLSYAILIGNLAENWADFTKNYSSVVIIVDENTEQFCLPLFLEKTNLQKYELIVTKAGELHKNLDTCHAVWANMLAMSLDRKSLCINLGGGVIGDMAGFCAATFKRGMDFVQVPTTLLSQVDSSIGGKLGIDFKGIKNCIGVFQDPKAVFIDVDFLKTLSKREIRSGFAEMIKHTLIADREEWRRFQDIDTLEKVEWGSRIRASLHVKREIVEKDPFEQNIRKALNFGHTIGHAVESHFLETETPLLHGEAIAIGMICEAYLSHKISGLSAAELAEIVAFFNRFYDNIILPESIFEELIDMMKQDKKNENQQINFALLEKVGAAKINQYADNELIIESLRFYNDNG